jgi:hypothetical protein
MASKIFKLIYGNAERLRLIVKHVALTGVPFTLCSDRTISDVELGIPAACRDSGCAPAKLNDVEAITVEGRAEFEG